jgi:uncharacterized protein YjbJ (UPF0337 family)
MIPQQPRLGFAYEAAAFKRSAHMGNVNDRPDDSNAPKHDRDSVAEETSATGQRLKGSVKEAVGDVIDDEAMEDKGARENAAGKDRQRKNDAV